MKFSTAIVTATAFLLMLPPAARAQQAPQAPSPVRGYIVGGAGASAGMDAARTSPSFSVEVGDHVTRDVQVYVTIGYHDNLMTGDAEDQLADVGGALAAVTGSTWNFSGRDRGRSLVLGSKYLIPSASAARFYVGGGFGFLNLKRTVREQSRGDLTAAFLSEFSATDGVIDATREETNKPLGELAAGVGIAAGKAYFDFGYRYRKAFRTVGETLQFSQFGASVGFKF